MIRALTLLVVLMAHPLAAQTLDHTSARDPETLTTQFKTRQDAGENPAVLAAELGRAITNPPALDTWFAPIILHAELLAEAQEPEAALGALTSAEGFFYTVDGADPMFLDWILILQGMRLADLGRYGEAADRIDPLLPSITVLFGQADHDALAQAVPMWRATMLVADPERAMAQLSDAITAYGDGNPARAETLARALLLPPSAVVDDPIAQLITASAHSLLSMIADDRANTKLARDVSLQSIALLTNPPWDGSGPLTLIALPSHPEFTDLAFSVLFSAATLALGQDDYAGADALMVAMTPLATTPARQVQVLSLRGILAGASSDLDEMVRLATTRLSLLMSIPSDHSEDIANTRFEIQLLSAFRDLKNGALVDLAALSAAATSGSALYSTAATEQLVTIGKQYLSPPQMLALSRQAIDKRDETTAALDGSETTRDAYLRAGRNLTESWLNAAFAVAQTDITQAAGGAMQFTCSDETDTAFCVIWQQDGTAALP